MLDGNTGEHKGKVQKSHTISPDSQCPYAKNPKLLSPTVPDFSSRFPFRGMKGSGHWPLSSDVVQTR